MPHQKQYRKPYEQPPPSPIEVSFWETAKPLIPELEKEVWIDKKYRVDFLIPSRKIVIELYGYQHHNSKAKITKYAERERYLQRVGFQVIRFTGTEVFKDVRKCVYEVLSLARIGPAETQAKSPRSSIQSSTSQLGNSSVNSSEADHRRYVGRETKPFGIRLRRALALGTMALGVVCGCAFFISMFFGK